MEDKFVEFVFVIPLIRTDSPMENGFSTKSIDATNQSGRVDFCILCIVTLTAKNKTMNYEQYGWFAFAAKDEFLRINNSDRESRTAYFESRISLALGPLKLIRPILFELAGLDSCYGNKSERKSASRAARKSRAPISIRITGEQTCVQTRYHEREERIKIRYTRLGTS